MKEEAEEAKREAERARLQEIADRNRERIENKLRVRLEKMAAGEKEQMNRGFQKWCAFIDSVKFGRYEDLVAEPRACDRHACGDRRGGKARRGKRLVEAVVEDLTAGALAPVDWPRSRRGTVVGDRREANVRACLVPVGLDTPAGATWSGADCEAALWLLSAGRHSRSAARCGWAC